MLSREVPFVGTKATDEEENDTDPDVGEDDAHPDLVGQRIHEAEHMGFVVHGLLDHDGDAQRHEGLGEVDHLLPVGSDGQRGDGHVSFLTDRKTCAPWVRSWLLLSCYCNTTCDRHTFLHTTRSRFTVHITCIPLVLL